MDTVGFLSEGHDTTYQTLFNSSPAMEKVELRKEVENMLKHLPEDANWDDVMYKIYVRQSIEQGLSDSQEGRVKSHEEIKKRYQSAQ
ncbi:MAG: hypothetical protein WEA36_08375 [Balneolaceae bacterium]